MASFSRKTGIVSALVIAGVLIAGAFILSGPGITFFNPLTANAESSQQLLQSYAQKDSDNDGLPDWQESLYGTDPNNAHSVAPNLTDGEAVALGMVKPKFTSANTTSSSTPQNLADKVPGVTPAEDTLTAQFSKSFFEQYTQASAGGQISDADKNTLIANLMTEFTSRAENLIVSHYTILDIHTSSDSANTSYYSALEKLITKHDVSTDAANPVDLMQALIEENDENSRPKLKTLATSYANTASALSDISVPSEFVNEHLVLLQSYDTLARATMQVANYEKDPIAVLGSIAIYPSYSIAILNAYENIAKKIITKGEPGPTDPGAIIVNFARSNSTQ